MARKTQKTKAGKNKQLWDRANTSYRSKWQSISQKGYDFYLDEQLSKEESEISQRIHNFFTIIRQVRKCNPVIKEKQ